MKQTICKKCGLEFIPKHRHKNPQLFCSRKCFFGSENYRRGIKNRRSYIGENNPFYGKKMSEKTKDAIRKANTGRALSEETIKKIKDNLSNERCYAWKGGISRDWWRKRILEKYDFTCQLCGLRDEDVVEADHIKPKHLYPELRYDLENGMALCANCHRRKTRIEHKKLMKERWKNGNFKKQK